MKTLTVLLFSLLPFVCISQEEAVSANTGEVKKFSTKDNCELGIAFYEDKEWTKALTQLDKALDKRPDYVKALLYRGMTYRRVRQTKEAMKDLNRVIKLDKNNALAYNQRGGLMAETGIIGKALRDFDKAIELKPGFAEAYYNRAHIYYDVKNIKKCMEDYDRAIALKQNFAEAWFNRGVAKIASQDSEGGCYDIEKSGELGYQQASATLVQYCSN